MVKSLAGGSPAGTKDINVMNINKKREGIFMTQGDNRPPYGIQFSKIVIYSGGDPVS